MAVVEATPKVSRFFTGGPKTLAALRVAAGVAAVLVAVGRWRFLIPPAEYWNPPAGTSWIHLPLTQELYVVAAVLSAAAGVCVLVGWRPAITASLAAAAVFYMGWATTMTGKVDHLHHVVWFLLVVAVSPSANVWTVRREHRVGSAAWPVTAVAVLIGVIYFGAGIQKLASAGLAWGWSDNLVNQMYAFSAANNTEPFWLLVEYPTLGRVLGVAALIFELGFLPLILHPKTRRYGLIGLVFHWGTWLILGIPFLILQVFYVVFIPFDRPDPSEPTSLQRYLTVGLIAAASMFAVAGADLAWPVAAYPGFEGIHNGRITVYYVDGVPLTEHPITNRIGMPHATAIVSTHPEWFGNVTAESVQVSPLAED